MHFSEKELGVKFLGNHIQAKETDGVTFEQQLEFIKAEMNRYFETLHEGSCPSLDAKYVVQTYTKAGAYGEVRITLDYRVKLIEAIDRITAAKASEFRRIYGISRY